MYARLRLWFFRLDPERAHALTLKLLHWVGALPPLGVQIERAFAASANPVEVFGLHFPNSVGLAAGYDKDGLAWRGLARLGFGHIEVGTVTLRPQFGNPRPRLFRLVEDEALINRLGFPGRGAAFVVRQLQGRRPRGVVLGVNVGLNKDTPLDRAAEDYSELQRIFNPLADYLAVNVSSPNTAGLRELQEQRRLADLLSALMINRARPILVKLSPDLENSDLAAALDVLLSAGVDGVILTNTTVRRDGLVSGNKTEAGGLSGRPLADLSLAMLERAARHVGGRLPIISVGGIFTKEDGKRRLASGATLIQVYSGLVFRGPKVIRELANLSLLKPSETVG